MRDWSLLIRHYARLFCQVIDEGHFLMVVYVADEGVSLVFLQVRVESSVVLDVEDSLVC